MLVAPRAWRPLDGTGNSAGFLMPLLNEFGAVHAIAPDLPGSGLSDPAELAVRAYRQTTVARLDRLLDALELNTTALVGHSGGGVWALWCALARSGNEARTARGRGEYARPPPGTRRPSWRCCPRAMGRS
jgi:pimeloyl-ACP methyl ester carboxylesterase